LRGKRRDGAVAFSVYDGPHAIMELDSNGNQVTTSVYGQGMDELIAR
jgi:hypothetical protein